MPAGQPAQVGAAGFARCFVLQFSHSVFVLYVSRSIDIHCSVRDVLQRVGAGAVDAQLQMQVVAAVGTAHIPGVAHIADHIALMHRLPRADAKAGHVRIQGGIAAAVIRGAVVDLHTVAITGAGRDAALTTPSATA